jgi:hypothetical protein
MDTRNEKTNMKEERQMERQYNHLYKSLYGMGAALACFLLLVPTFWFIPADAQQSPPSADAAREQELDTRITAFFTTLASGNSSAACEEFLRSSPLGAATSEVTELRNKTEEARTQFGLILDWEKYKTTERVGEDIVVIRYILKYDQYPVIWTFIYYRKPTGALSMPTSNPWVLIDLRFDTNILNIL